MPTEPVGGIEGGAPRPSAAGPGAWFARHPAGFRFSVGAAAAACVHAVGEALRRRGRGSGRYWMLAAITAVQVVGLLWMRPRPDDGTDA